MAIEMKFQIKVAFILILCCVLIMEVTAGRSSSSSSKSSSSKSSSSSSSKPCEPKPLKRRVKWLESKLKKLQDRQDAAEKMRGLLSDIVKQCKADLANLQSKVQAKCDELQEKFDEVNDKVDGIKDDLDPCKGNPCQNDGTCENPIGKYQCTCNEPWKGEDCSEQDPCAINPCLHDGSCTKTDDDPYYECECIVPYFGDHCQFVSGISQYITPAADDQFQYFRLSNPIPFNGTKGTETSTEYKTLESVGMLDVSVGHVKTVTSYKAFPGFQGSVSLERFGRRFITFNFRGRGNALLLFQEHETIDDRNVFLVEIGGGQYYDRVAVYDSKLPGGNVLEQAILPDTTSLKEYRSFWISWDKEGSVLLGLCNNPLTDPVILRAEHAVNFSVNHVSISTTSNNVGIWQFAADFEDLGGCQAGDCMGFFKCDVSSSDYTGTCVVDQANGMSYPESGTCVGGDVKTLMKRHEDKKCCQPKCDDGFACIEDNTTCVPVNDCPGGCTAPAICCGTTCECPWPNVMKSGSCQSCSCDPDETCSINGDCFCGENKVRQNGSCVDCEPSPDCDCTGSEVCTATGECVCGENEVRDSGDCVSCTEALECNCPGSEVCTLAGDCICEENKVREGGVCVLCDGTVDCDCPGNEVCAATGNCVCGENQVRDGGVCVSCVEALDCNCPSNEVCTSTGECVCGENRVREGGVCVICDGTVVCPVCTYPQVCVVDGPIASCQCPKGYHDGHAGDCVKDIVCPVCIYPKVCVVDGPIASCQCPKGYHDGHAGDCVKDIECPICSDGKECVVREDGDTVCACPAGTVPNMMGTCSKCPASCMTSADCVNTGEMCSNGVCECLAGEKLVPGRCVREGHIGGPCLHGLCYGSRVRCDRHNDICVCDSTCLPSPSLKCIPRRGRKH